MPNYVYNILTLKGKKEKVKELRDVISSVDQQGKVVPIDFNKIIPKSSDLDIRYSNDARILYKKDFGNTPLHDYEENRINKMSADEVMEATELSQKYLQNEQKYGHITWHDWCNANWGTKWNAMLFDDKVRKSLNKIYFCTAWSPPMPVLYTLACKYPEVSLKLEYFEESEPDNLITVNIVVGEPPEE